MIYKLYRYKANPKMGQSGCDRDSSRYLKWLLKPQNGPVSAKRKGAILRSMILDLVIVTNPEMVHSIRKK